MVRMRWSWDGMNKMKLRWYEWDEDEVVPHRGFQSLPTDMQQKKNYVLCGSLVFCSIPVLLQIYYPAPESEIKQFSFSWSRAVHQNPPAVTEHSDLQVYQATTIAVSSSASYDSNQSTQQTNFFFSAARSNKVHCFIFLFYPPFLLSIHLSVSTTILTLYSIQLYTLGTTQDWLPRKRM